MKVQAAQWIGTREHQEDVYRVRFFPEGGLAVVCDGMGGHRGGALAAAVAAETFVDTFADELDTALHERLLLALESANEAVGALFEDSPDRGGTTLLAVFVGNGVLRWVSVGDSGLLLWRHGRLIRLNEDHSMRGLLQQYLPAAEAAIQSGAAHMLRSAVMGDTLELIDAPLTPFPLLPSDCLILCSDGGDIVLTPGNVMSELASILNHAPEHPSPAADIVALCRSCTAGAAANRRTCSKGGRYCKE